MRIHRNMDLRELAVHMGQATVDEAKAMRTLLVQHGYSDTRTEDVPREDWREMRERTATPKLPPTRQQLLDAQKLYYPDSVLVGFFRAYNSKEYYLGYVLPRSNGKLEDVIGPVIGLRYGIEGHEYISPGLSGLLVTGLSRSRAPSEWTDAQRASHYRDQCIHHAFLRELIEGELIDPKLALTMYLDRFDRSADVTPPCGDEEED